MDRAIAVESLLTVDRATTPVSVAAAIDAALARLGVSRPRAQAGTVHPLPRSDWPGSRRVSELELRFHEDMLAIFRLAGEATRIPRPDGTMQRGYWASYFLRGVRNHGGPEYAHQLLRKTGTTPGFERLRQEGRLELTVEALVLQPKYASLFTQEERRIAAHRLAEAGYSPPDG